VVFTLTGGEVVISRTIRESFAEYSVPILRDTHFLHCHSAYLINMRRVERFARDIFTLRGGKTVPIAAKQYSAVRDQYMTFLMAGEARG
ncbi:MAG: LytTR family transcriptional regulator DNA-binding domain-containing protein, partial [Clostridia bacterium]|nr:LytTR family transcriptional regulator DNA-binding domain-containing protein [Clostridia bacterium]